MGTFVVGSILICIILFILRSMIRKRKSGKNSCGGDCGHCGRRCH